MYGDFSICAKTRYMDKIESIGGLDPFSSDFVGEKSDVVPPVSGCDLVSYLLSIADHFYN